MGFADGLEWLGGPVFVPVSIYLRIEWLTLCYTPLHLYSQTPKNDEPDLEGHFGEGSVVDPRKGANVIHATGSGLD